MSLQSMDTRRPTSGAGILQDESGAFGYGFQLQIMRTSIETTDTSNYIRLFSSSQHNPIDIPGQIIFVRH